MFRPDTSKGVLPQAADDATAGSAVLAVQLIEYLHPTGGRFRGESSINGPIRAVRSLRADRTHTQKRRRAALLQSPLTVSNRGPSPYHGGCGRQLWDAEKALGGAFPFNSPGFCACSTISSKA
jgi:hypothetical protein